MISKIGVVLLLTLSLFARRSYALATMSVDLSSEFMKVAIVKPGVPMEIVLNTESHRKTPVAVAMRNGERTFGDAALSTCIKSPKHCFVFFLDLLGKDTSHELVKLYQQRFPQYHLENDPVSKRVVFRVDEETTFAPEELLAMLLKHAKFIAEKFAEQPITDAVITIPPFYTQVERIAVAYAARLAGLNLLQLMNDNTAAALNYAVFRTKDITTTTQYLMLYDMGSTKTTATIVGYQLAKLKEGDRAVETPQLVVKGVGYDRTLGALEIDIRLRKFFVEKFKESSKKDASNHPQALAKLLKEAARVKRVLSANVDHQAQVEGLMDDVDFSTRITRAELEGLCGDLFDRIPAVVEQAVAAAGITLEEITQVIILGGGTRIPKIQERLLAAVKRTELGKSLNSDEAVAMGSVYQAAHLSKGFRVKRIDVVDATVIPIVVEFERAASTESTEGETTSNKLVKRALFARSNSYPQRKLLTFAKHTDDFNFTVRYSDYEFLPEFERGYLNKAFLADIKLSKVGEAFKKNEDKRPKGIKTHFKVDASGIFALDTAEALFEHEKEEEVPSTMEKIGQTISNFFSGSPDNSTADNATTTEAPGEEINASNGAKTVDNSTAADKPTDESGKLFTATKVNKTVTVKEKLDATVTRLDLAEYPEKIFTESKKRLIAMDEKDRQKAERERARNVLETYIFDMQDKLYQEAYEKVSTEQERESALTAFRAASEWLDEEASIQSADIYEKKLKDLKNIVKDITNRVSEAQKRPQVLADLEKHLNTTRTFMDFTKNLTGPDGFYTEAEVAAVEKLVKETEEWRDSNVKQQAATPLTKAPVFLVSDVVEKIRALDREVKYLANKMRIPKTKPKTDKSDSKKKKTESKEEKASANETETINPDAEQPADVNTVEKEEKEYTFGSETENGQQESQSTESQSEEKSTTHNPEL